ncbi:hypothetical protein CMV_015306 [Castanea mollissima]|uniref:Poly(A) RNA polymerase mitochondrial-like central palm domain-containing protein n=1 Tax=Castanea mollissima TaxID=60419 RepID=A0A8J4QVM8_9ROSI|nr:hypothetical protein CMV_015306 [Castanea mollissima]
MSANSTLEHILEEILEVLKPKQKDLATRAQVINELRRVVESVPSLRGAAVEPFGSFVSNLFTKWGDVDISINLTKGGYISHVEYDRKIELLQDLKKSLTGRWQMVQLIPARVPILKCESSDNILSCDISIDNLIVQIKSKLLLGISEIDGRFRDMVLLVKEWAKAHEINDATPMSGTFTSYSLTLLVIFHFQTCEPAIFPPLKDIYAGNVADDLQGLRTERNIAEACAANIRRFSQDKFRPVNHSSLSEIFISFLAKIEDPFEWTENSARAVSMSGLTRISEAFEMSRVISADQNLDSLLATLVRPQVSPEIKARHNQGQHSGDTGTSSAFVSGLLLGGLVAGTLSYMFAPEISKAADGLKKFFDNSDDDSDEPKN